MTCATCKNMLGIVRSHTDCPVRASIWCSQCSCYGHFPSDCDVVTHVRRPESLEELIPEDVRNRWGITTRTHIVWHTPLTMDTAEREIAESNTIIIRKNDGAIRTFMKQMNIPTAHAMDRTPEKPGKPSKPGNIQLLRTWAIANGKKVRLVQE